MGNCPTRYTLVGVKILPCQFTENGSAPYVQFISQSIVMTHSNAQKEVQRNTRAILNSLEHEMNEDYVSRFIYYFAVNIMNFLKNEMKLREIIAL